ncbi:hypothetical protein [Micropruina sp.]|uniref:HD domain-containing protein n=1 Tax=Micropruina sp. TaxID=2737536 RepID=UPI0039E64763
MADSVVLNGLPWPLPGHHDVAERLLSCWREPHRSYHGVQHLAECLAAARQLGAAPVELLALWFHDARHTNTPGLDEEASAALARDYLHRLLPAHKVAAVERLVLLTLRHLPEPGDRAGAIVCDADLWVLGADPARYIESVGQLRDESGLTDEQWATMRREQLALRIAAPIYHTQPGRAREPWARANLLAELGRLAG